MSKKKPFSEVVLFWVLVSSQVLDKADLRLFKICQVKLGQIRGDYH